MIVHTANACTKILVLSFSYLSFFPPAHSALTAFASCVSPIYYMFPLDLKVSEGRDCH